MVQSGSDLKMAELLAFAAICKNGGVTLGAGSIASTPSAQGAPTPTKSVSDPDPLSYAKPQPYPESYMPHHVDVDLSGERLSRSLPNMLRPRRSPGSIYLPGWGVTNDCGLDTPATCQDTVDHIAPPRYFSELRHLPNADFLSQYNMNLARQVAMGSQLRLRFEQEVRAIETEVYGLRNQTKNLETLLEAEADMKKAAEAKNAELTNELESLRVWFSDLQVIGHGMRLAVMKCAELTDLRHVFANVAYDPEANDKLAKALQNLKDLEYPMVDQLERLKDALMELIMASLHLEGDTREDAP
ncbi:hypothetical protein Tco_0762389 [Tanacetum coccineum]